MFVTDVLQAKTGVTHQACYTVKDPDQAWVFDFVCIYCCSRIPSVLPSYIEILVVLEIHRLSDQQNCQGMVLGCSFPLIV